MQLWPPFACCALALAVKARQSNHEHLGSAHSDFHFQNTSMVPSSPSEDCNHCIIEAPGGVSLIYWEPDDTNETSNANGTGSADAGEPHIQVEDGFTFTSPSVYVAYSSLQATYACNGGSIQTLGSAYQRKTIGYSSRFLAYGTLSSPEYRCDENVVVDGFHTIDFSKLYYNPITTSMTTKAGCPPYVNPRLSMPADLTDVDLSWGSCQPLYYGAFDPPRVLTKVGGALGPPASPSKPASMPETAPDPIVTKSQSSTRPPNPAIQGPQAPNIASPTATVSPTSLAKPAITPAHGDHAPANVDAASLPHVDVVSPGQTSGHTDPGLPVANEPSEDPGHGSHSLPAIPVSAISNAEPPQPGASQAADNVRTPHANIDPPLSASKSKPSELISPQIIPVMALPPGVTSPLVNPGSVLVLPKGPIPGVADAHNVAPQAAGVAVQQTEPANAPMNAAKAKANEAPFLIALPDLKLSGSGGIDRGLDSGNSPSALPDEVQSLTGTDEDQDTGSTQPQNDGHTSRLTDPILFGLSGPAIVDHRPALADAGHVRPSFVSDGQTTDSQGLYLAVPESPTPLAVGTHNVKLETDGQIVVGSKTIERGQQVIIDGTPISVARDSVVVGKSTHSFDPQIVSAIELTASTIPLSRETSSPSRISSQHQIFEVGDLLVTQTDGLYGLRQIPTPAGTAGRRVTLGFVDGKDGSTSKRVVTLPTEFASLLITRSASEVSKNIPIIGSSSTFALASGFPRSTGEALPPNASVQAWPPISRASSRYMGSEARNLLKLTALYAYVLPVSLYFFG